MSFSPPGFKPRGGGFFTAFASLSMEPNMFGIETDNYDHLMRWLHQQAKKEGVVRITVDVIAKSNYIMTFELKKGEWIYEREDEQDQEL